MTELQLTIEELKISHMEAKVQQLNHDRRDRDPLENDFDNEEELFDRLIELGPNNNVRFIMCSISSRQRAEFFDRVRVVNAYEHDGMTEREYMVNFKIELYNKYLSQQ